MEALYHYAYTSSLHPDVSLTDVARIVQVSRRNNVQANITGVLIFDGWHFFQYVEGDAGAINALIAKLAADPRHVHQRELLYAPFAGPRQFRSWAMGYAVTADDDLIARFAEAGGQDLLARIPDLLACCDMEP